MKRIALLLFLFASLSAFADSVTLIWNPSPGTNVAGYYVYYGGASRTYTNKSNVGNTTNATVSGILEGPTYFFALTAYNSDGLESDYSNELAYGIPAPPLGLAFDATNGSITLPFQPDAKGVFQSVTSAVTNGGIAVYNFSCPTPGRYVLQCVVTATNSAGNSFFVNIDSVPVDPIMVWDVPINPTEQSQTGSWRGANGTESDQYIPLVFYLSAGNHTLRFVGREPFCFLRTISITPVVPSDLTIALK